MDQVSFVIRGTSPLMMHNVRLANPLDPIVKEIKEITKKGKRKTDDDYARLAWLEWFGGLYWTEETGPYIPPQNIDSLIRDAARLQRQGKDVVRGVMTLGDRLPLQYKGPRDPEKMFNGGSSEFIDCRAVGVNKNRCMRYRPYFREWSLEFTVSVELDEVNRRDLISFVDIAGRKIALGDGRPRYGRYESQETSA